MAFLNLTGLEYFKIKNDSVYARNDGSYDAMTVGNAEQLASAVGVIDKVPYNFRTAGGSADISNRETDKLVGGTVVWNQMANSGSGGTVNGITYSYNSTTHVMTVSGEGAAGYSAIYYNTNIVQGHKYFMSLKVLTNPNSVAFAVGFLNDLPRVWTSDPGAVIQQATSTKTSGVGISFTAGADLTGISFMYYCCDLTRMFGSAIADYVYSLETANEGAGIAWFRKLFPKNYYSYNAGELMSVKTNEHKTVGFNAYDNSSGKAKLVGGMQYQITGAYTALSLEGETVTPDGEGYFTAVASGELTVTGGNGTTTCVHLVWDGERDGEYESYESHSYPLDDVELRGIPKLDANNRLYYDGDVYESDGTVTRLYASRDYESGDELLTDTITDGTTTVYKLTTPTTESAEPYQNPQIVRDWGTEEYIDAAATAATPTRDVAIPVGHETFYQANLKAKLEMAPNSPAGDGDYIVRQTSGQNSYVLLSEVKELPEMPSEDGTYSLKATVESGVATLAWVADE